MAGKKGGSTVSRVWEIARPIADSLGLGIWDVTFDKEGALYYLRVLIERPGGSIDMDDCEAMTRPLSKALDEADPIEESYMLEVGSPGLGRSLRREEHFREYMQCPLRIRYIREKNGVKEFIGVLDAYDAERGTITVITENGTETIELSSTAYVKLYDDDELSDDFGEE